MLFSQLKNVVKDTFLDDIKRKKSYHTISIIALCDYYNDS